MSKLKILGTFCINSQEVAEYDRSASFYQVVVNAIAGCNQINLGAFASRFIIQSE